MLKIQPQVSLSARRAWIEISARASRALWSASLSARRAWIEIASRGCGTPIVPVALRKESVDRNHFGNTGIGDDNVALRKESVDRNKAGTCLCGFGGRRSPQGERG